MKEIKLSDERKAQISERARREGGYFPWYFARMQNNHEIFLMLAEELKKRGCRVFHYRSSNDEKINLLYVHKENLRVLVGFAECPFHWYISGDCKRKEYDLVGKYGWDLPFDADEVLERLEPYEMTNLDKWFYKSLIEI